MKDWIEKCVFIFSSYHKFANDKWDKTELAAAAIKLQSNCNSFIKQLNAKFLFV